jgi:hypothetical protein
MVAHVWRAMAMPSNNILRVKEEEAIEIKRGMKPCEGERDGGENGVYVYHILMIVTMAAKPVGAGKAFLCFTIQV